MDSLVHQQKGAHHHQCQSRQCTDCTWEMQAKVPSPNYGKRKMNTIRISGPSGSFCNRGSRSISRSPAAARAPAASKSPSNPDQELASRYEHKLCTLRPAAGSLLPQHTYFFFAPSSSFNASSFVAPGTQPPLAGTTTAGVGQGQPGIGIDRKKTALIFQVRARSTSPCPKISTNLFVRHVRYGISRRGTHE